MSTEGAPLGTPWAGPRLVRTCFVIFLDHATMDVFLRKHGLSREQVQAKRKMWTDYSAVFPTLNEQGRALEQGASWQFVTCNGK